MSLDIVFTILIVALAAAWAGRRLWRTARRRATLNSADGGCGDRPGGCDNCLATGGAQRPDAGPNITPTPCDESQTDKS